MRFVLHTFRHTETIDGVFRLLGRHNLSKDEIKLMRQQFNEMNGKIVPRPGMTYKIPLPYEAVDDFGNIIETPKPTLLEDEESPIVEAAERPIEKPIVHEPIQQPQTNTGLPQGQTLVIG